MPRILALEAPMPVLPETPSLTPCAQHPNPDLWAPRTRKERDEARFYCAQCPIAEACAEAGRTRRQSGVWGGVHLVRGERSRQFDGTPRRRRAGAGRRIS